MPACPKCGKHLSRQHRTALQKLIYSEVLHCSRCARSIKHPYSVFNTFTGRFLFSRYSRCVRCGTVYVQRSAKRDRIDSLSGSLYSRIQHLLGAPLNKCVACRLQYYDWRRPWTPPDPDSAQDGTTQRGQGRARRASSDRTATSSIGRADSARDSLPDTSREQHRTGHGPHPGGE